MSLRIRRIERAYEFMSLSQVWSELERASGQESPFLSYDWFWCCWHGVWPSCRPEVLLMEDANGPVAILPLMHWQERLRGFPVRCLGFLDVPCTPMVDILTAGQHEQVIETFLDHLAVRSDWDTVWLQKLPIHSATLNRLEQILPGRFPWRRAGGFASPYVTISGAWNNFCNARKLRLMQTDQILQDRPEYAHAMSLEEHKVVDPGSPFFREAMDVTCRRSEKCDNGADIMAMPRRLEFFRVLTRRASKNGWLSLWLLRLKGQVIAVEYQLQANSKVHVLWSAENPRYRNLSPGMSLTMAILRSLFDLGGVHEYIIRPTIDVSQPWWADGSQQTVRVMLSQRSLYARFLDRLRGFHVRKAQKW